jgi:sulfur carrier protein
MLHPYDCRYSLTECYAPMRHSILEMFIVLNSIFCSVMSNASNSNSVSLQVNGEPKTCEPHTPLPQLLEQLKMNPRLVAVEYNGEILHRQFWQETEIQEGDRLEIVTIVGGG